MKNISLGAVLLRLVSRVVLPGIALFCVGVAPARAAVHVLQFEVPAGFASFVFFMDDPNLNGKPTAKLTITQRYVSAVNKHPVGVIYDATVGTAPKGRWGIFNEDTVNLPPGSGFNVLVGSLTKVNASAANSFYNLTFFSKASGKKPFTSAPAGTKPGFLFFTHNFEPFQTLNRGLYVNHIQSLDYSLTPPPAPQANKWYISNEDTSAAPAASYFIFDATTPPIGATVFGHTSSAQNINVTGGDPDETFIDNPATNDKSDAVLFITHVDDATYNTVFAVLYNTFSTPDKWTIVDENGGAFKPGANFNVLVFPAKIP